MYHTTDAAFAILLEKKKSYCDLHVNLIFWRPCPQYAGDLWTQTIFLHVQLGLQSTLVHQENVIAFPKKSSRPEEFDNALGSDCCFMTFLRGTCKTNKKHLTHFQNKTFVFKFLQHSVDRALSCTCSFCWLKQLLHLL